MLDKEIYSDSLGNCFIVKERKTINNNLWVYYYKITDPDKEYSCLNDAFLLRFTKMAQ